MNFNAVFQMNNYFPFVRYLALDYVDIHYFKKLL